MPSGAPPAATIAAAPPSLLPVPVERQFKTEWCWVANALALGRFHGLPGFQGLAQCEVAERVLGGSCQCAALGTQDCNNPQQFDAVLESLGFSILPSTILQLNALSPSALTFADVRTLLDAERPIVVQIQWVNRVGEHLIMLFGYEIFNGENWVYLRDPLLGSTLGAPVLYKAMRHQDLVSLGYFQTDSTSGPIGNWVFSFYPPTP